MSTTKRVKDATTATHPDDRAAETKAIDASHLVIDAFFEQHREEFVSLVLTYADDRADRKLAALRELFWSNVP